MSVHKTKNNEFKTYIEHLFATVSACNNNNAVINLCKESFQSTLSDDNSTSFNVVLPTYSASNPFIKYTNPFHNNFAVITQPSINVSKRMQNPVESDKTKSTKSTKVKIGGTNDFSLSHSNTSQGHTIHTKYNKRDTNLMTFLRHGAFSSYLRSEDIDKSTTNGHRFNKHMLAEKLCENNALSKYMTCIKIEKNENVLKKEGKDKQYSHKQEKEKEKEKDYKYKEKLYVQPLRKIKV